MRHMEKKESAILDKCVKFVSKSVQATLTKHRQMGLNHRNLFFTVLRLGVQDQETCRCRVW